MEEEQKCKCPAGIPAWVLTFADLMSLLMCFFVLLLSFSEMDVQKFKQIAGSMKAAFGVQRDIKVVEIPKGVNIVAKEFSPAPPQPTVINEVRQITRDDTQQELKLIEKLERLQAEENELKDKMENMSEAQAESEGLKKQLQEVQVEKAEVEKELIEIKQKMDQLQQQQIREKALALSSALKDEIAADLLDVEFNDENITIRLKDKGSFASGTDTLTDDFVDILEIIADELSKTNGDIIVAGHTDDIPISTARFSSNWALSAARSVSVVHELLRNDDLERLRFSIQAFAEARPLVPNDSPENRAKNRRVEIILSQAKHVLGITKETAAKALEQDKKANGKPNDQAQAKKSVQARQGGKADIPSAGRGDAGSSSSTNNAGKPLAPAEESPSFIQF